MILLEKPTFLRGGLGSSSNTYGLDILLQCDKRVGTKSQKVLRDNLSYYRVHYSCIFIETDRVINFSEYKIIGLY